MVLLCPVSCTPFSPCHSATWVPDFVPAAASFQLSLEAPLGTEHDNNPAWKMASVFPLFIPIDSSVCKKMKCEIVENILAFLSSMFMYSCDQWHHKIAFFLLFKVQRYSIDSTIAFVKEQSINLFTVVNSPANTSWFQLSAAMSSSHYKKIFGFLADSVNSRKLNCLLQLHLML